MMNNPMMKMFQTIQQAQNPMGMMQNMLGKNPQFQKVMKIVEGKSPQEIEQFVRNAAKTQNFDLDKFFSQFGLNLPQKPQA